jgi:hypothetical protein
MRITHDMPRIQNREPVKALHIEARPSTFTTALQTAKEKGANLPTISQIGAALVASTNPSELKGTYWTIEDFGNGPVAIVVSLMQSSGKWQMEARPQDPGSECSVALVYETEPTPAATSLARTES